MFSLEVNKLLAAALLVYLNLFVGLYEYFIPVRVIRNYILVVVLPYFDCVPGVFVSGYLPSLLSCNLCLRMSPFHPQP